MSIRYTVRPCNNGGLSLVDHDVDEDISDYFDEIGFLPRGLRDQNGTVLVRLCKKPLANSTSGLNSTMDETGGTGVVCQLKRVSVASLEREKPPSEGGIPDDILEEIERDGDWAAPENDTQLGGNSHRRLRRQANENWTEEDSSFGASEDEVMTEIIEDNVENMNDSDTDIATKESISLDSEAQGSAEESRSSNLALHSQVYAEPERLLDESLQLEYNLTDANATDLDFSFQYDDYIHEV